MKIKHYFQPTGNSCGPTCLYMALEYVLNQPNDLPFSIQSKYSIEDIAEMCGTDWVVGTPPDKMEKGLKALNLNYIEYQSSPRPYDLIFDVIRSENVAIIRTITRGIPHWIIVNEATMLIKEDKYEFTTFDVLDPWLGEIKYTKQELDDIWSPRKYQFFEIQPIKKPVVRL